MKILKVRRIDEEDSEKWLMSQGFKKISTGEYSRSIGKVEIYIEYIEAGPKSSWIAEVVFGKNVIYSTHKAGSKDLDKLIDKCVEGGKKNLKDAIESLSRF